MHAKLEEVWSHVFNHLVIKSETLNPNTLTLMLAQTILNVLPSAIFSAAQPTPIAIPTLNTVFEVVSITILYYVTTSPVGDRNIILLGKHYI